MTYPDAENFVPRPKAGSAAKAIREAICQDVDVISMSWTIVRPSETANEGSDSFSELENLIANARKDRKRIPLIFCSARDKVGITSQQSLSQIVGAQVFRIGAATDIGNSLPSVASELLFPGVNISVEEPAPRTVDTIHQGIKGGERTGSSVTSAPAAGLAALFVYCTKLGQYHTTAKNQHVKDPIFKKNLDDIKKYENMLKALNRMSVMNSTGYQYAQLPDAFENITKDLKRIGLSEICRSQDDLAPIAKLARYLDRSLLKSAE